MARRLPLQGSEEENARRGLRVACQFGDGVGDASGMLGGQLQIEALEDQPPRPLTVAS